MKKFNDHDASLLRGLPSPFEAYEQEISIPEFTFLGVKEQPDFGEIKLWFYADQTTIELKSLKDYIYGWRDIVVSYERVLNCIYDDLIAEYNPSRLRIEITFRPRGGISSTLRIDSDWEVRGGTDRAWQDHSK